MITVFKAEGFRCLKHVELQLGRLHALIGPNDSGKSTILHAIQNATAVASRREPSPSLGGTLSFEVRTSEASCWVHAGDGSLRFTVSNGAREATFRFRPGGQGHTFEGDTTWAGSIISKLTPALLVRFDTDALRRGSSLLPKTKLTSFLVSRGAGLPGVYNHILGQESAAFATIESHAKELFPNLAGIRLSATDAKELAFEFHLRDGTSVGASAVSDGLLYYLAFAAVRHVLPTGTLLIEEPENGLHPARIRDVVRILRDYVEQNDTQVIMATHSPLVVNELKPDEVTVVTRTVTDGTKAVLIKDTPNFERRSKAAELGELWLSYADGESEAPLLNQSSI